MSYSSQTSQENLGSCFNKIRISWQAHTQKKEILPITGTLCRPYSTEISQEECNLVLKMNKMSGCGITYHEQKAF